MQYGYARQLGELHGCLWCVRCLSPGLELRIRTFCVTECQHPFAFRFMAPNNEHSSLSAMTADDEQAPAAMAARTVDISKRSSAAASATLGSSTTGRRRHFVFSSMPSIRPFHGIVQDIRSRAPFYLSDWMDAWNYRVVPATLLIFFSKYVVTAPGTVSLT